MANTANSMLQTNFNVTPYYDDYDETKGYYRILFKPGFAVQARELTQIQTILQKQVDRFGKHVFEEGSIVLPGNFQLFVANTLSSQGALSYVKVKDNDNSNNAVTISNFDQQELYGQTSKVKGVVNIVIDGTEASGNTKTIYVDYITASNTDNTVTTFAANEILTSNVGNLVVVSTNPTGKGSAFRITSGVLFAKGHFIYFPTQDVVLDRYNPSPTCKVGFKIIETIVKSTTDASLLDPALEASNYSAPGADRLKLTAELQVRDINDDEDLPDFVTLFTIKDGIIQTINDRTQYSILKDEFAKRTFDESGDYYVSGLDIELREHLNDGTNGGLLSVAQGGDANLISVRVDAGTAYVKGYEVGTIVPTYLTTDKATAFANVNSQFASAFMGSYVTVEEMVGHLEMDVGVGIELYDTYQNRISNGKYVAAQTGNKIGTANVASIEYNTGTLGTPTGRADLYLMDIRMLGTNTFSNVRSVYINNASTADFGADIVPHAVTGDAVLNEPFNAPLLYYVGSDYTRKVKSSNDTSDTTFYYNTTLPVTIVAGGTFNATAPGSDTLPYSGTLSTANKREIFLSLDAAVNVTVTGTASNVSGNTIVGSGTTFTSFNVGDKIEFSGMSNTYTIAEISNTTYLKIAETAPFRTLSGNTIFKAYKVGDYIDLNSKGVGTGAVRTVTASGSTLSFTLNETLASSTAAEVTFRAAKTSAPGASKTLKQSRYVKFDCSTAGTTGPFNLGFSDVYRIKQIRKDTSAFTTNTQGTLVTSSFIFDNGQKDTHYDFGTISPKISLTASDKLLVELDYFAPDYSLGKGFFTVESYTAAGISIAEIPVYKSSSSGQTYDLRNYIDCRPVKTITAADSTTVAGATQNPGVSAGFIYTGDGISLVAPSSTITYDYQYYLARKDVVHINKDKTFSITKGQPASTPITPQISDNEMALAVLTIAPYPSISPYYAKLIGKQSTSSSVKKVAPVRHTMRDIGVMKERIKNLEYYASLSLLEKNALDMLVLDANGNDRFKNGIFVDTFSDHLLGATYNEDYRIVVDPTEKSIRPLYSMQSIGYDYLSGSNVRKTGDLVTLDYSEVEYANNKFATATLNTERSTYRFIGNLTLVPENDIWVDTITLPPNTIEIGDANIDGLEDAQQAGGITTTWNSWQTRVVGYKVYSGTGTNKVLVGTYSTQTEAERAAQLSRTSSTGATIETLYESARTGTETFNYVDSDTASIGSRVVDTQIIPYIRPQVLMGACTGLKPYARFKVFFDGIDMSDYVRPVTESEYGNTAAVRKWTYAEGAAMLADANGQLWFRMSLPNTDNMRFTVGQKLVLVTDSLTGTDEATSYADKFFFAQGIVQTKQDTILSTRQVEQRQATVTQTTNSSTVSSLPPLPPPPVVRPSTSTGTRTTFTDLAEMGGSGKECLAYVLPIKSLDGEEGIFLTSIDIFCAEKHPTLGVWFEIRELDAGGGITLNTVPFSIKWFKNADVPISTNGQDNPLSIVFDSPVFLYADKSYALVIHPEASNPNYYFWISRIGQNDVNSGKPVTSRAYLGTMFTTNNNTIWVPIQDVDLTCVWYRASFVKNVSASFYLGNKPKEKLYLNNIVGSLEGFGENFFTGDKLTLSGITAVANDFIIGGTSGVNSRVIYVASGKYSMANIRYTSGETVTVRYGSNGVSKGTGTISAIDYGRGVLEYYKEASNATFMILNSSNGVFAANDAIFDVTDEGSARIQRIGNLPYSVFDFEPAMINFSKTTTTFDVITYTTAGVAQPSLPIEAGENYEFTTEMAVFSRSNEMASLANARSMNVRVNMYTTTNTLSPVFDIGRTQGIIVNNIINSNTMNETLKSGGYLYNKYISKIVTLAEGQDAEDIMVYLTSYRPPSTDVKVWVKILNGEDAEVLTQKPWIELEKKFGDDITYSSLADKNDFIEYTYGFPTANLTGSLGQVQYTNGQGIKFTGYKSFQVKIGLLGDNNAIVPRVADLRVIALQI